MTRHWDLAKPGWEVKVGPLSSEPSLKLCTDEGGTLKDKTSQNKSGVLIANVHAMIKPKTQN